MVALMKLDLALRGLVNSEYLVKKVLDRVHYLFQQCSTVLPEELHEETSSMRTTAFVQTIPDKPPSSIESGKLVVERRDQGHLCVIDQLQQVP